MKERGSVHPEEAGIGIALLLYFDSLPRKESMYAISTAALAGFREWLCEVFFETARDGLSSVIQKEKFFQANQSMTNVKKDIRNISGKV